MTKQELIDKIKEIISLYPLEKDVPKECLNLYKETKILFETMLTNINSMDDALVNTNPINQLYSYMSNCHSYIEMFSNNKDIDELNKIRNSFNDIIKCYNEMHLIPLKGNDFAINNNKIIKNSFDTLLGDITKIKEDSDNKISEINQTLTSKEDQVEKIIDEFESKIEKYESDIRTKGKSTLELIEKVTGGEYSKVYNKFADEEEIMSNDWRKKTFDISKYSGIGFTILGVIGLFWIPKNIDMATVIYKIGFLTPIFIIIFFVIRYCSKQSSEHREKSHKYRSIALRTVTIDSYIASLPDELQYIVKIYVAGELFSNDSNSQNNEENNKFKELLSDEVKEVLKSLKEDIKAEKPLDKTTE